MTTRSDRYLFEKDESKSRVAKNQKLYEELYETDSYFSSDDNKPSQIEKTNEIDIEKVKELLKGREIYRREMKLREINMGNSEEEVSPELEDYEEEKNYDINAYLNKASSDRVVEPYHKIDPEHLCEPEIEQQEDEEPSLEELKKMNTTALSLEMFGDLSATTKLDDIEEDESDDDYDDSSEEDDEDDTSLVTTITQTDAFFTDSVKLKPSDSEDDEDEGDNENSPLVKIILALLVIVIIALVVFIIIM